MQRQVWVLSGEAQWCRTTAQHLLKAQTEPSVWIPQTPAAKVLGQTLSHVVFDTHLGLDSNALALSAGTIRAGGVLVLLTPSLQEWAVFNDPDYTRFIPYLYSKPDTSRFIQRLLQHWQAASFIHWLTPSSVLPQPLPVIPAMSSDWQWTSAQLQVLEHLQGFNGVSVLLADRGRGKSTLLGEVTACLTKQGKQVAVTAPKRAAIQALVTQYESSLLEQPLTFFAPDDLLQILPKLDVLIVDEAATIPIPLLMSMQQHYPVVIFSTTVQGYEGSGRGFILKFLTSLEKNETNFQRLELIDSVRWDKDDQLELLLQNSLLLGHSVSDNPGTQQNLSQVVYRCISQDELLQDEFLLKKLFLLLVSAHYQTRPSDLRQLLDAPNISIHIVAHDTEVLAVALLSREGGFDTEMTEAVFKGKRRPQGNLLAQTLTWHSKLPHAAQLIGERVMRIAVKEEYQGQGLGQQLVQHLMQYAEFTKADYIGVSYSANDKLIAFWERLGLVLIRKGFKRDKASGEYAAVQLRGLSQAGKALTALPAQG